MDRTKAKTNNARFEGAPARSRPCPPFWAWLAAGALGSARCHVEGQEALHYSLAGQAAAESMRAHMENLPYTFKTGDFKVLVKPSLGLDYNDNINVSRDDAEDDFILRPLVQITGSYPIGRRNLLQLDVGIGYDKYFQHDNYSGPRLSTGSQVAFDIFAGDFRFDLHDRFEYVGDSAGSAAVAGNSQYQYFQNTVGLGVDWDQQDLVVTLGYDHLNYISAVGSYDYLDHATEMFLARAGLKLQPNLTVGLEGTAAPTSYDQHVLNENVSYSAGAYGTWNPGSSFSVQPRAGYTIYDFRQTSTVILAHDIDTWYADLTLQHQPTAALSYRLSCGHELRLGIQSDLIEDTYLRPGLTWKAFKALSFNAGIFYEHGKEAAGRFTAEQSYDWYGGTIGANWNVMKNMQASLSYRLTLRSSDTTFQEYTQNLVSLFVTYTLE